MEIKKCDICRVEEATEEPIFDKDGKKYLVCESCEKEIYDRENLDDELTLEEAKELLRLFLGDEVYLRAMQDVFTEEELIDYVKQNKENILERLK